MISLEKMSLIASLLISIVLAVSVAFVHLSVGYGNLMFYEGRYDDSMAGYNRAITMVPDSATINFNIGNALYKKGEWEAAVAYYSKARTMGRRPLSSMAGYNSGNAAFMMGQTREGINPDESLVLYRRAVAYYKEALSSDGTDRDAKHNLEHVERKIAELEEKLLKQKDQQEKDGDSRAETRRDEPKMATGQDRSGEGSVRGDNLETKDLPDRRDRKLLKDIRGRFAEKGDMSKEDAELLLQEIREGTKVMGRMASSSRMGRHLEVEKDW